MSNCLHYLTLPNLKFSLYLIYFNTNTHKTLMHHPYNSPYHRATHQVINELYQNTYIKRQISEKDCPK